MNTVPVAIETNLNALCTLFDDELERQHSVLAIMRAQGEAARAFDLDALNARTDALDVLMNEALESERRRLELLETVVSHFSLDVEHQTLSDLIAVVPEPWKHRLMEFQTEVRATVDNTRSLVFENAQFIRRCLRGVETVVDTVQGTEPTEASRSYDAEGNRAGRQGGRSALLNAVG